MVLASRFFSTQAKISFDPPLRFSLKFLKKSKVNFTLVPPLRFFPKKIFQGRLHPQHLPLGNTDYKGCEKSFRQKPHLKDRMIRHLGTKKFKCHFKLCDKNFVISLDLKPHFKRKHKNQKQINETKEWFCTKTFWIIIL